MKVLFYLLGVFLYVIISLAFKYAGYILGGIPTALLFGFSVYLVPRILIKRRERNLANKKIKKLSAELKISADIPAHCESVENNEHLMDYLQTCVKMGLLTQDQCTLLFEAYKNK